MTDGPTNRINRPPARRGDRDDARTQLAPQQGLSGPPTSRVRDDGSYMPTQASPLAWSQDDRQDSPRPRVSTGAH